MDISFLDYSLKICLKKAKFCINPIEEFVNLGIKEKEIQSKHLKDTMIRSGLVENEDFELTHVRELRKQGGSSIKNIYLLKPKSFKKLLLDINDHKQQLEYDGDDLNVVNFLITLLEIVEDEKREPSQQY
jgi:hypothetical protein